MGVRVDGSDDEWGRAPLVAERLLSEALTASGRAADDLEAFGGADFLEPLQLLAHALEREASLHDEGRRATHRYLRRLLDVRLELEDWERQDPGVADELIVEPLFVIGAPRTGTTAVHRLLVADPAHRAPEAWELLRPVPPPEPATFVTDARISSVADELLYPQRAAPGLRQIHTYAARMPKECLSAMSLSFRSEEFISRYHVPSYVEWFREADMTPAYEIHRRVLRVLQRRMPRRRWVLKSPVHLQALPVVVRTYPDAVFVATHRDPVSVLASVSSLVATMRSAFSDTVDPAAIGRYHSELYARSLDTLVDHVDGGLVQRVAHAQHASIVADPVAATRDIYRQLDLGLDGGVEAAMRSAAAEEREDAPGAHRPRPADFGIDPSAVRPRFQRYLRRFYRAAR